MVNEKFKIRGMHCPSCEMLIKDIIEENDGIKVIDISRDEEVMEISYDENNVNMESIKQELKEEGYEVEKI